MPSESRAQQHFMGAELNRKRHGEKTDTGMSEKQLDEFASTKTKHLPEHAGKKKEPEPQGRAMKEFHHGHGRHKKGRGKGGDC